MIEKILRTLFDYQKYENDPGLSSMIDDTHKRYDKKRFGPVSLKDDDLGLVSAAGEIANVQSGRPAAMRLPRSGQSEDNSEDNKQQ